MQTIELNNKRIVGTGYTPYFIAEVNTSHFGDIEKAKKMIDMAKRAGADCVKFQSWSENSLYSTDYYRENPIAKRFVKKFSFNDSSLKVLSEYCKSIGIDFASTPYSVEEADFLLNECGVPFIKVASMDLVNQLLLTHIAKTGSAVILSTGMGELSEIQNAVDIFESLNCSNLVILHCVSIYPTPNHLINLSNIVMLKEIFSKYPIGFSDHTLGSDASIAAVALGSTVVEKHITLDNTIIGMDNQMAMEESDYCKMINSCKNTYISLGNFERIVSKEELDQRKQMRRSVVAKRFLPKGTTLSYADLDAKRPETGIPVRDIDSYIGRKLLNDIMEDSIIQSRDFEQ